jgi:hypothetical protein
MIGGAAFEREDFRDGFGIRRIGAEAVDGLGGKRDDFSRREQGRAFARYACCAGE